MQLVDNYEDFVRYYKGTFIAIRELDRMVPYYVQDSHHPIITILEKSGKYQNVDFNEILDKYKLSSPRVGSISTELGHVYISIIPERQYKKALCDSRLDVHGFCRDLRETRLSFEMVDCIYNNKIFDPSELLKTIKDGERLGGAISHKMGIHIKPNLKNPLVTYKANVIGQIVGNSVQVLEKYAVYKDYIIKTMPGHSYKVWEQKEKKKK